MDMSFNTNECASELERPAGQRQGLCCRCREPSTLICMRCEDCYCSKQCQLIDWKLHRYICFPKPPLVEMESMPNDENVPNLGHDEPLVLADQLRSMIHVCQNILKRLEIQSNCKCIKPNHKNHSETYNSDSGKKEQGGLALALGNSKDLNEDHKIDETCSNVPSKSINGKTDSQIVYLTSFRSANRVGICPKEYVENGFLGSIIQKVDKYGQNASKLIEMPKVGSYVIALRSKKFSRAKVVEQKDQKTDRVRLEFLDYGNLAYRRLHECRGILPELAELPVLPKIVQLNNVELIGYDEKILSFLSNFERKYYKMIKVAGSKTFVSVELYDDKTGQSVNEQIKQLKELENNDALKTKSLKPKHQQTKTDEDDDESTDNLSQKITVKDNLPKEVKQCLNPVMQPPFENVCFQKNWENFKAVVLDTVMSDLGYMSCIKQTDLIHLSRIQNFLANSFHSDEPYAPVYNEYVIAKFDDSWYRGKVIGISSDKNEFEIIYIDFLNMGKLTRKDIRRYPLDLNINCYTTLCVLADLPQKTFSQKLKNFLQTNINDHDVIHIDRVVDVLDEDVAVIECPELKDRMRKEDIIN